MNIHRLLHCSIMDEKESVTSEFTIKLFFFYLSHKPMLDNIIGNNLKIFSVSSSTVNSYGSVRMGGGEPFQSKNLSSTLILYH